ncbi:MAG TPA: hypothetical protein PK280_17485, partial [Planctomycetota bacterium]|nr:hypothetical protein [Planctomycetota bacterium]
MESSERESDGNPLRLLAGVLLGLLAVALLAAPFVAAARGPLAQKAPPDLVRKPGRQTAPVRRSAAAAADLEALRKGVDLGSSGRRLAADVAALAASDGRMAGSPGAARAAELIRARFEQAGLTNVQFQEFPVTVPVTVESSLTAGGQSYPVKPFWPNAGRTCTIAGEVQAPLVYGGDARLENLSGQDVSGALLVLDGDRGMDWVTACSLGARGVIFIEPAEAGGIMSQKVLVAALDVPRFWLPRAEGLRLVEAIARAREGGSRLAATVRCRVDWVSRTARNVYGLMPGRNPGKQRDVALVAAAYDAPSLVPDLAPGAEPAASVAAMFELLESFKTRPPERPVLFLAVDAHFQAMLGDQHAAELFRRPVDKLLTEVEELDGPALGVDARRVLVASGATVGGLVAWQRVLLIVLGVLAVAAAVLMIIYLPFGARLRWTAAVATVLVGASALAWAGSRLARERKASAEEIAKLQAEPAWKSCSYTELRAELEKLARVKPGPAAELLPLIERREKAEREAILARGAMRALLREEDERRKKTPGEQDAGRYSPPSAQWLAGFAGSAGRLEAAARLAADFQPAAPDRASAPPPALADYDSMRRILVEAQKDDRGSRELDRCLTALANQEERLKNSTPGRIKYLRYCGYLNFLGRLGPDMPERVKSCIWLDIASRATSMAVFYRGQYVAEVIKRDEKNLQNAVSPLAEQLSRSGSAMAAALGWNGGEGMPFVADTSVTQSERDMGASLSYPSSGAEIFLLSGMPSVTLGSVSACRRGLDTPMDLPARMDFSGLALQTAVAVHAVGEALGAGPSGVRGLAGIEKMESQSKLRGYHSFLRISGLVTEYDPAKSRTLSVIPVPGALVLSRRESLSYRVIRPTYGPVRAFSATLADRWGGYEFFGLPAAEVREWNDQEQRMLAFQLDPASGRITYALDEGEQGQKRGKPWRVPRRTEDEFFLGTFQCAALNIFEVSDLRSFEAMDTQFSTVSMIFGKADAVPISWGLSMAGETPSEVSPEHAMALFVQKTTGMNDDRKAPRVKGIFGRRRLVGVRWPMLSVPGGGWEAAPGKPRTDRALQAGDHQ